MLSKAFSSSETTNMGCDYMEKKKRIFVFEELCNGCRLCEMACSFVHHQEFNPHKSLIRVAKVEAEGIDTPLVDCNVECLEGQDKEPECVRLCSPGALIYSSLEEADQKRQELVQKRKKQPIFKVIAPWKWPYPWREWPFEERSQV